MLGLARSRDAGIRSSAGTYHPDPNPNRNRLPANDQVSHDPDRKIVLPKKVKFDGVKIKSCLTKEYPDAGPYAGGILFKRW